LAYNLLHEHTGAFIGIISFMASVIGIGIGAFLTDLRYRLKNVEDRQSKLREEILPEEYVRKDALEEIKEHIGLFLKSFEKFMQDCHDGKCTMARIYGERGVRYEPGDLY
jgi:hypothetical protein